MKKVASTFALLSLIMPPLFAAGEAPNAKTEAKPANTETVPAFELQHKSSFTMEDSSRNPFWPIGWKPPVKLSTNTSDTGVADILPSAFVVSSITVDSAGSFAIVNGRIMTVGQVFGLQKGTQTYQITVKAIEDGQVILLRRDQEIAVPLHRR